MSADVAIKRVYLDVSALGRLFDDQHQIRVRVEADAVRLVLTAIERSELALLDSPALRAEIGANPNRDQRDFLQCLLDTFAATAPVDVQELSERTQLFRAVGASRFDAVHVAYAQLCHVDFVTCDDRLLRLLERSPGADWYCGNPVDYCRKVGLL